MTHIGLLTLLAGVTITSWTGFSGFKPILVGESLSFSDSEHSKLWIGHLPKWHVKLNASSREDYQSGDAKQWYSDLTVVDENGKSVLSQQISVNNPLTYQGVDVYQSSWGLDEIRLRFNEHSDKLKLRPMGKIYAAFLPLAEDTTLIMSVKNTVSPLRVFAKRADWPAPRLVAEIKPKQEAQMGGVTLTYDTAVAVSGLQYKCDPGLPVTYVAFGFIIAGVLLAMVPHRQVWGAVETQTAADGSQTTTLNIGGRSPKDRLGMERSLTAIVQSIQSELSLSEIVDEEQSEKQSEKHEKQSEVQRTAESIEKEEKQETRTPLPT